MTKPKLPAALNEDRPRRGGARAAGEMIGSIGAVAFKRFGFVQSAVVSRWSEIVGDRYAKVSTPESIRFPAGKKSGGTLNLWVEGAHAPLLQQLAPMILERVNRFFGYSAVAKISLRQGASRPAKRRPAPPESVVVPVDLGAGLREIADPELRTCLESLAGALARSLGPPQVANTPPMPSLPPESDKR